MFNVTKNKVLLLLIPIAIILAGAVGFIINGGFEEEIDFAGGTAIQIAVGKAFTGAEREEVADLVEQAAGLEVRPLVQATGNMGDQLLIKTTTLTEEQKDAAFNALKEKYSLADDALLGSSAYSPSYGSEMKRNTLIASLATVLLLLVFIGIRFEWRSGVVAIGALAINVGVVLSVYALFRIPLSTTFIAAILTVLGYGINDAVVIFDRIRENMKFSRKETYAEISEKSIWQSFVRTITTGITTLMTIVIFYFIGAPQIKDFALPIIIGIICGSYTSIFVASPWWAAWKDAAMPKGKRGSKGKKATAKAK